MSMNSTAETLELNSSGTKCEPSTPSVNFVAPAPVKTSSSPGPSAGEKINKKCEIS